MPERSLKYILFILCFDPYSLKHFKGERFPVRISQAFVLQGGEGIMKRDSIFDHSFIAVA